MRLTEIILFRGLTGLHLILLPDSDIDRCVPKGIRIRQENSFIFDLTGELKSLIVAVYLSDVLPLYETISSQHHRVSSS